MRSHQVAVLLSTFATVALVAPAVQAGVISIPISFVTVTGGFSSPSTPPGGPDPINGISATINGTGSGSTIPFTPATGGALSDFVAANALGSYTYQSSDINAKLEFDLLAGGTSVFNQVLSNGIGTISSTPFNFDLSAVVPPNFNLPLVIRFLQTGNSVSSTLAGVKLEITTKTPEPGNMTAIGLLGLGLAGAATRRQLQEKAKTKV